MAGNGPNDENRRNGIDQGKKQAAVEGGRRPQRRRFLQSKGIRKQGPNGFVRVTEEVVHRIEESLQPFCIKPRREIFPDEARAQLVIALQLKRSFRRHPLAKNSDIIRKG
jgi:hypothetical protein